MPDVRDLPFRPPPPLIPKHLLGAEYTCSSCKRRNQIDWTKPQPFPKQPIVLTLGEGHLVPTSITQVCLCGNYNHVPIPTKNIESSWGLFGDEAERIFSEGELPGEPRKAHFFTMTLASMHQNGALRFQRRLNRLKKSVRPDWEPDTWKLHMTEIWSVPPNTKGFALGSKAEKIRFIRAVANLLRKSRPDLFTMNVSSCRVLTGNESWNKLVKANKQEVFATALMSSLQTMGDNNKSVYWSFDHSVPPEKRTGSEGWAEEVFLGLQYSPVFTWLSAGNLVQPPRFRVPGSHYLLEVADALSFLVARDFDQRVKGRHSDFPSSLTGLGIYQAFDAKGDLSFQWGQGLPFDKLFPQLNSAKLRENR